MKKTLLLLAVILCCAMNMMAEPVSQSAARQAAARFLENNGVTLMGEAMKAPRRVMGCATDNEEQTEASPYYVFNASASKGFVIVSGDDCVGDNLVLGYTSQGSFDADNIPANMQWWLDQTASQIEEMSRRGMKARRVALHDDVAPLVTALWDQGENTYNPQNPFNAFCPETDGKLCITGCLATALSQVMYYHRWPQGPLADELPAYTMENGRVIDALPATTFDWDNMVDDYRQPTTDEQQAAVAKLMRYCGQVVQMDYTPSFSGGYFYDIDLLVRLFGYDQGVYRASANDYSVSGWDELLYNELHEGRPLVYVGSTSASGHAFVIDGYEVQEGSGYFHVNWGWSGGSNGFFKINLLNPKGSGAGGSAINDGYNQWQEALIGLMPAQQPAEAYGRYLAGFMWDVTIDEQPHVFSAYNTSYKPGVFEVAWAERQTDGTTDSQTLFGRQTLEVAGYIFAEFSTEQHSGRVDITLPENLTEGLTPGRHELVLVNKEAGTDAPWRPIYGPNCFLELIIGDDGLATDTLFHPLPQLTASSLTIEGLKQRGIRQDITTVINNNGGDDYIGLLFFHVYSVEDDELKELENYSRTNIMIETNGTVDLTFKTSVNKTGDYVLVLENQGVDYTGTKLSDIEQTEGYISHQTFTIEPLAFYRMDFQYNERSDDAGNPAYYFDVTVGNGTPMDYKAALLAKIYTPNSQGYYDPFVFPDTPFLYCGLSLPSNYYRTSSIRLPEALEPGDYGVELLIANDFQSLYPTDYFVFALSFFTVDDPTTGIASTEDERGSMSDKWYSLDGRKLDGRPTAKGLYIHGGRTVVIK